MTTVKVTAAAEKSKAEEAMQNDVWYTCTINGEDYTIVYDEADECAGGAAYAMIYKNSGSGLQAL